MRGHLRRQMLPLCVSRDRALQKENDFLLKSRYVDIQKMLIDL